MTPEAANSETAQMMSEACQARSFLNSFDPVALKRPGDNARSYFCDCLIPCGVKACPGWGTRHG